MRGGHGALGAGVQNLDEVPHLVTRQLGQKQVVGLHAQRAGHQGFGRHYMAIEQMHMVGMEGHRVLQYFLDRDHAAVDRKHVDQRLAVGGFTRARPAKNDDVLTMADGDFHEPVPVASRVGLLHVALPVFQGQYRRSDGPGSVIAATVDVIHMGEAIQRGFSKRGRQCALLACRGHDDLAPLPARQLHGMNR
ncbi:hypothetical protein ALO44_200118 [Pseudomonas syringae pv. tagetis]|uniref:XRE family transcriptional regulator n=1 Tax=Pseudomonas syringae pv. tagetis TaxID=129140 RepID=A0A0Q0HD33_9PSED|nr:hypothetical protein ALO44_200118 [Pseudomonas syringae pv. tagetis]